ncbi:hypothetical protein FIBSPDRAFT_253865 [Athelia psychrophila]|uniref:Uncharacterized protein n=1 Tax=Athelia psychrophila TaxID=1759441 RepID=A0A165XQE1_9AGAM|nr:hypothetical protein FIBSPDRAFT_253865 [Fibularhizoctonia sp. CBS 109695]
MQYGEMADLSSACTESIPSSIFPNPALQLIPAAVPRTTRNSSTPAPILALALSPRPVVDSALITPNSSASPPPRYASWLLFPSLCPPMPPYSHPPSALPLPLLLYLHQSFMRPASHNSPCSRSPGSSECSSFPCSPRSNVRSRSSCSRR